MIIMKKLKPFLWLVLFGSLWGLAEVVGGGFFYQTDIPLASVWLAAWGFFMLAIARGICDHMGTSTFVAAVAVFFRSVNASPFFCHLLGIFILGVAFDIVSSYVFKLKSIDSLKKSLAGIFSAYIGYASFAIVITAVIRYEIWIAGGFPKVMNHIFVGGSLAALLASAVVPIGYNMGQRGGALIFIRPRLAYTLGLLFLCILWSLKIFIG